MKIEIFGIKNKTAEKKFRIFAGQIFYKTSQVRSASEKTISKGTKAINIIIVNDKYIHKLNKQFLKKDRPTDVLSFPVHDVTRSDIKQSEDALLGEIYISRDRAKTQAKEQNITQNEEICNLVRHGILHLLGYTHGAMKKLRD